MNKTKIVCSIGPASCKVETLEKMIDAGMNVARFNMSHGTHESHKALIDAVKQARRNKNAAVAILIDTKGPEVRVKQFEKGKVKLADGQKYILSCKDCVGNSERVAVTYPQLYQIVKPGAKILLNDGHLEFNVDKISHTDIICTVVHGGELSNNKSINIPGVKLNLPYLSDRDKQDLLFAKEMGADYIAASFVTCAADVLAVRQYLKEINHNIKIIAKVENEEGVRNFDEIFKVSDGQMVARGDLGVEIDFVRLPILQKEFIYKCNKYGKISITATQMLESMTTEARPTRAEISDVANAVFDGSTAVMLSGETASGDYPVQTVQTMSRIAQEAEEYINNAPVSFTTNNISKGLGYSAYALAQTKGVSAIIVVTQSGVSAANISRFRPRVPVIACTPNPKVYNSLAMLYGVMPVLTNRHEDIAKVNAEAIEYALKTGLVCHGDKIALVSGTKAGKRGTNELFIKQI